MDTRALDTDPRRARSARLGAALLLAAAALAAPAGGLAAAASPATPEARSVMSSDTYEAKVELLVNARRAEHGLRPVHFESCADLTAERWAERVAATGDLVHQSSGAIIDACRVSYAGETLGRGSFGPRALVRSWMRSPMHRMVVLSPLARRIGVGSDLDDSGRWVTSASFTRR